MDEKLFDKRVIRRNIDKGLVSQREYDKFLSKLANVEEECTEVEITLYPSDNGKENDADPDEEPKPE